LVPIENGRKVGAGKSVEGIALCGSRLEPYLLRLAVHDDELITELREYTDGGTATTNNSTTATFARDSANKQQFAIVEVSPGIANAFGDRRGWINEPATLNRCLVTIRTNSGGVCALAKQQPERGDNHRLSRTRLAGKSGEAGA
jgi:hypothetical protein